MDNFDLKKYLKEGRLLKEAVIWNWDGDRNSLEQVPPKFKLAVKAEFEGELSDEEFEEAFDAVKNFHADEAGRGSMKFNSDHWAEMIEMDYLEEGSSLKEEIMVNPIIMFGGNDYIKDVLTSPDDYGFNAEDAGWIKNNILTAPKMVSIEDYMNLEDEWVKQADLDVGTGADREAVLDAIDVHVKQGLITPEEGKKAKKIALNFDEYQRKRNR